MDNLRHELYYEITDSLGVTGVNCFCVDIPVLTGAIVNRVQYGTITRVEENTSAAPRGYQLDQNFPNPFNPSTQINDRIPAGSFIALRIYDLLGRTVATLVNG